MGKKRSTVIGSEEEIKLKADRTVKLEQKKLRTGKAPKVVETTPAPVPTPVVEIVEAAPKFKKPEHKRSKAYKAVKAKVDVNKTYAISDGITLLRKVSLGKFDPTVELHLVLKKSPESKLSVTLPHLSGNTARKVVIASDEVISAIEAGHLDFDVLVASPAQMPKLVKLAKVLGPKGLMPNPKNGTVSPNPEAAAKLLAADQSQVLKLDKTLPTGRQVPVIHTSVGKLSLSDKDLSENITAVMSLVSSNLKKTVLKSTMSPAIKIQA